ncbi:MAG: hypothetical protein ACO1QB_14360 [Verrucomicrobiales bacterium]
MRLKQFLAVALLGLFMSGCSTTITNLTPRQAPRSDANIYPFEVVFESTQNSLKKETIKASVLVGLEEYPMQKTPLLENRWEALVPVPPGENFVYYRYKFVYDYRAIPQPKQGSKRSPQYQLEIINK